MAACDGAMRRLTHAIATELPGLERLQDELEQALDVVAVSVSVAFGRRLHLLCSFPSSTRLFVQQEQQEVVKSRKLLATAAGLEQKERSMIVHNYVHRALAAMPRQ